MTQKLGQSSFSPIAFKIERQIKERKRFQLQNTLTISVLMGVIATFSLGTVMHSDMWALIGALSGGVLPGVIIYGVQEYLLCRKAQMLRKSQDSPIEQTRRGQRPDVVGHAWIGTTRTGKIQSDQKFKFSERLKDADGQPIKIQKDDLYIELKVEFETPLFGKIFQFRDSQGVDHHSVYLPASLLDGVQEGGVIRFIWDDRLIELTCCQKSRPFEEVLLQTKELNTNECLWIEDVEVIEFNHCSLLRDSLFKHDLLQGQKTPILDFESFELDQQNHGKYQQLQYELVVVNVQGEMTDVVFDIQQDDCQLADMHLIESKSLKGDKVIWIIIPHHPEKNLPAEGHFTYRQGDLQPIVPKNGDRIVGYKHGQLCQISLTAGSPNRLFFNECGYLQLSFLMDETE